MEYSQIQRFCRKHDIILPASWNHSCQAIRYHNKGESRKHFEAKSRVGFELMKRGQTIFTEFEFHKLKGDHGHRMNFPVCDLFWLDELIILEFESAPTKERIELKHNQFKPMNTFVFDLRKTTVEEMLRKIGIGGESKWGI